MKNRIILSFTSILVFGFLFTGFLFAQHDTVKHHHQTKDSLMIRQHMIHDRSSMVMPFDMNKVTHFFIKTNNGGIIMIKAKDLNDTSQIALIRSHLKKEQNHFSNGDFNDPTTLHGLNMPGIDLLEKSKAKFHITYKEVTRGAELNFISTDSNVIEAIHKWFTVQMRDHGIDAKNHE